MLPAHHHYPRSEGRSAVLERCAGAPALFGHGQCRRLWRGGARAVWPLVLVVLTILGCEAEPAAFAGSAPSLEALAAQVLDALSHEKLATLDRVRLTEHEHNDVVWPQLPAAAPEVNFPVDFAWSNIQLRNQSAVARMDELYEGRALHLEHVECRGETEAFESFEVLTDCWVTFTVDGSASRYEAQIFKDVLARGGGYKIFRYYDEAPRRVADAQAP